MSKSNLPAPSGANFLLYTALDGAVKVDVFFKAETVWLTQKALAELFGVRRPAITKHLLNIFATGELAEDSVCSILEHTAGDGKTYSAKYYNLDAIIAVGYRVNSFQATQFRIWATNTLREFIIKRRASRQRNAWITSRLFSSTACRPNCCRPSCPCPPLPAARRPAHE
jgi:hypothetical protein